MHDKQLDTDVPPVAFKNVPGGHGVGVDEPDGQYDPALQMAPVALSVGAGSTARKWHTKPALHAPVGAVRPGVAQ